ncbi:auxin-responsive protein saur32 [Quercus suber]|uniref:Auxin-responsive protein saur32 n=1 Tax=Quercus suber TaxID=58331 RepID=A0AAW0K5Y8_QUESU
MLSHPDMDPPTFSERVTHSVSTNKEILADKNLFDGHFSNIDKALNTYPFPSQSTTPQKETPSLDHPVIISADQTHHVPPTPYLDRALATPTWKLLFPKAVVHHVLMPSSDHSMLAIRLNQPRARQPRPKPLFRFEVMWLQDPRCAEIVQDAWHKGLYKPDGVAIINCYSSCRDRLSVWNKTEFDHVGKQIGRLNQKLQTLEQHLIQLKDIPKGCLAVMVGQGEEQQRFVIPVIYINHPLFMQLLKEAEKEFGFDQKGPITIPCHVEEFRTVQGMIDKEQSVHHHHHVWCFRV